MSYYYEEYWQLFKNGRDTFELVSSKRSVYGDDNNVYIHKEQHYDVCRILCVSEGRARKEKAIADNKGNPFIDDIDNFRQSIQKGTIKKLDKIESKLKRIIDKHSRLAAKYEVSLDIANEKATGISVTKKVEEADPLFGCYVIESSHADISAAEIWKLYMTLTRVENAFRSMKETLGLRPVYHQTAGRTSAHLFVTVLAYHLLATIENLMTNQGDTRTWGTLRDVMSTLMRGTVSMRDDKGATYNIRLSGSPEEAHQDILDKLNVNTLPKTIISKIDTL